MGQPWMSGHRNASKMGQQATLFSDPSLGRRREAGRPGGEGHGGWRQKVQERSRSFVSFNNQVPASEPLIFWPLNETKRSQTIIKIQKCHPSGRTRVYLLVFIWYDPSLYYYYNWNRLRASGRFGGAGVLVRAGLELLPLMAIGL